MREFDEMILLENEAPDEETAGFLLRCAVGGVLEELGYIQPIRKRLEFILHSSRNAVTTKTDDVLLEIAAKHLDKAKYPDINAAMVQIVTAQCKPYCTQDIKNKMVPTQEWDDYYSILTVIIVEKMPEYDAARGKAITYLRPFIMKEFFENRNEGTRYNSSITKAAMLAKSQLMAEGITNPDAKAIADRINMTQKPYKEITPTQVKHALDLVTYNVEIDENTSKADDIYNPERHYIEKERNELFEHVADFEHPAIRTLFEIYKDYYFSDNPEEIFPSDRKTGTEGEEEPDDEPEEEFMEPEEPDEFDEPETELEEESLAAAITGKGKKKKKDDDYKKPKYRSKLPIEYLRRELQERTGMSFSENQVKNLLNSLADMLERKGYGSGYHRRRQTPSRQYLSSYKQNEKQIAAIEADILEYEDIREQAFGIRIFS